MNTGGNISEIDGELEKLNQDDLDHFLKTAERSLGSIGFDQIDEEIFNPMVGVFRHRGIAHLAWNKEIFGDEFSDWGAAWITFEDWLGDSPDPIIYQNRLAELNDVLRKRAVDENDRQPTQDILHLAATLVNIEVYLDGTLGPNRLQALLTDVRPAPQELPFRHRRRTSSGGKNANRSRHRNALLKTSPFFIITQTGDYFSNPKPRLRFIPRQVYGKEVIEKTMGSIQRQYQISESFRSEARRRQR